MTRPLAIDLFCGLGGWTDGLLAEGYDVIGFDITQHVYGEQRYPAQLVVQDVTTLHGSQFRNTGTKRPGIKLREVGFNVSMAREVAADLKGAKYERSAEDKRQHIGINRKAASAMIAKIPLPLSRYIAATFRPDSAYGVAAE